MRTQSKRDMVAAASIAVMSLGAFALPSSWLGLISLVAGLISMLVLILIVIRDKQ